MSSLKGTKTEQNLLKAFAGESQARNRYTFFASKAKKKGKEGGLCPDPEHFP
jgi:rubrerythrin